MNFRKTSYLLTLFIKLSLHRSKIKNIYTNRFKIQFRTKLRKSNLSLDFRIALTGPHASPVCMEKGLAIWPSHALHAWLQMHLCSPHSPKSVHAHHFFHFSFSFLFSKISGWYHQSWPVISDQVKQSWLSPTGRVQNPIKRGWVQVNPIPPVPANMDRTPYFCWFSRVCSSRLVHSGLSIKCGSSHRLGLEHLSTSYPINMFRAGSLVKEVPNAISTSRN